MSELQIHILPLRDDNYGYVLIRDEKAIVIDPSDENTCMRWLSSRPLHVTHILLTHYHSDHIGGVEAIRRRHDALVVGPSPASLRVDITTQADETLSLNDVKIRVIDTPGHAFPHASYYFPVEGWLFSGDCLFGAGCGRLANNNAAATMWQSLRKLAALPDSTKVFCGHEYTWPNLAFAISVERGNAQLVARRQQISAELAAGRPSVPFTIEMEKLTNPFLRVNSPEIRKRLNMDHASEEEVFTTLRTEKNTFRG